MPTAPSPSTCIGASPSVAGAVAAAAPGMAAKPSSSPREDAGGAAGTGCAVPEKVGGGPAGAQSCPAA
eukprot:14445866-Alexandrium_andersonii.AAC.1